MKIHAVLMLSASMLFCVVAQAQDASDPVEGCWWAEDKEAVIAVQADGDSLQGRIVWLLEPEHPLDHDKAGEPVLDEENPDPALMDRPVLGLRILWGFERHRKGDWRDGEVYDPENGRSYRARLRSTDDGEGLRLRGYVGTPMLGRTAHWQRHHGALPGERGGVADVPAAEFCDASEKKAKQ